jgi:DNA-binding PadR family transcriptional regulator
MAELQPMTEAMYYILLALLHPGYGYGTMQRVSEISGGRIQMGPGTLYGVLTRMKKEGLIVLDEERDRRKTYSITEKGRAALNEEYARLKMLVRDGNIIEEAGK